MPSRVSLLHQIYVFWTNNSDLPSKDVQAIFDPVVDYIIELVNEQYRAVEKQGKSVAVGSVSMEKTTHILTLLRLSY